MSSTKAGGPRAKLPSWGWLATAYASIPYAVVLAISLSGALSPTPPTTQPPEVKNPSETAQETTRVPAPQPYVAEVVSPPAIDAVEVDVTKIVDGDTIWVEMPDGSTEKVRFIGVDTPESTTETEPYGTEASAYTGAELMGKTIYLETDAELRDRYGRLLAHVWLEMPAEVGDAEVRDHLFNARLLLAGYASLMTMPPNVKYVDFLQQYEGEARTAQAGLWAPAATFAAVPTPAPTPAPTPPIAAPVPTPPPPAPPAAGSYIANSNTGKFHHSYCRWVDEMLPEHRVPYATRDQAAAAGYIACKVCNP